MVSAFLATAFAQDTPQAASQQWRRSDQAKSNEACHLMDSAEEDVLAYMTFPVNIGRSCTAPIRSSD